MGAGCVKDNSTVAPDALHIPAAAQERKVRRRKLADYRNCVYAISAFERHQTGVWNDPGVRAIMRFAQELPLPTIMFTEDGSIGFANEPTIEISRVGDLQYGNQVSKIIDYTGDFEDLCYREVNSVNLIHGDDGTTTPITMYTIAFYIDSRQRSATDLLSSQSGSQTGIKPISEKILTDVPLVFISFFDTNVELEVTRRIPQVFKEVGKRIVTLGGSATMQADAAITRHTPSERDSSSDTESDTSRSGIIKKLDLKGVSPKSSEAASPVSSDGRSARGRHRNFSQNFSQPSSELSLSRVSSTAGKIISPRQSGTGRFDALAVAMSMGDVLLIIDPNHRVISSASPAALQFLGFSSIADIVGKPISFILHSSEHETHEDPLDGLSRLADLSGSSLAGEQKITFITSQDTQDSLTVSIVSISFLSPSSVVFRIGPASVSNSKRTGVRFQYKGFPDELAIMVNSFAVCFFFVNFLK